MKLRDNTTRVKTNTEDSTAFTIKTSAKAFKILSDNLYSDKITAVIRELSCNAYDSHVEAGKEKTPFEVHLPTRMQPWLSVRDCGVGMSHDDVMNLYTSYFDSDKTNSNKVTGVLGLGSKSPFAYTDIFTVESIYEGKKRLYSCFINKDGTPNITLMDESDTYENNGVEVKMSVHVNDCEDFKRKAASVLSVFKTKPKVTGVQNLVFDKPALLYKGRTWKLRSTGSNFTRAIQGNVAYIIAPSKLTRLSDEQYFVVQNRFDIHFNIGELDITASREDLSYDDITIKNIKKRLDKVYYSFHKSAVKQLDVCKTLWKAKLLTKKLYNSLSSMHLTLHYKGKRINADDISMLVENLNATVVKYTCDSWNGKIARYGLTDSYRCSFNVQIRDNVVFVVNDENRKGISKARNLVQTEKKVVYLITGDCKSFLKAAGNPPFVKASSLPAPIRDSNRYNGGRDYKKIYMPIQHGYMFYTSYAISYDALPKNNKIFYMATKRGYAYRGDTKLGHSDTQQWVHMARDFKIIAEDTNIYGISTWNIKSKKIETKKQFVEFFSYVEKKIKNKIKREQAQVLEHSRVIANHEYIMKQRSLYDNVLQNKQIDSQLDSGSKFFDLKRKYDEIIKIYREAVNDDHIQHIANLAKKFKMNENVEHDNIELVADVYPMIAALGSWNIQSNIKIIVDYIKLIDRNL